MPELNDISPFTIRRLARLDASNEIADRIRARIAESDKPYDRGKEQYLAGLRDALALALALAQPS